MINGVVTDVFDAVVPVRVVSDTEQPRQFDAVLDTGFSGMLTIPAAMVADLGLQVNGSTEATMADGRIILLSCCDISIEWNSERKIVTAWIVEEAMLIGMELLQGHRVELEVVLNGIVSIRPLDIP